MVNTGEKVAIDCHWGIRGFGYEWRSPGIFMLRPGNKKKLEYKISDEKIFHEFTPETNIFFEYKTNKGLSLFSRRELLLEKVSSGEFYNVSKVSQFHPAVILSGSNIKNISELFQGDDSWYVIVNIELDGRLKKIQISLSRSLLSNFDFSTEDKIKGALGELTMRKIAKMLQAGKVEDYMFTTFDLPNSQLSGFKSYTALRDSLDK